MKKLRERKSGFTLIELLITIAILSLVMVVVTVGIVSVIDSAKDNSKKVTEKGIKEAAKVYSSEVSENRWYLGNSIEGFNVNYDLFCVTIGELVKKGLLEHDKVKNSKFELNNYVAISRNVNTLAIEKEELVNDDTIPLIKLLCTGNSEGAEGYKPKTDSPVTYTDEASIKFNRGEIENFVKSKEGNNIEVKWKCYYDDNSSKLNYEGEISDDKCNIKGLKNDLNIDYYSRICLETPMIKSSCSDLVEIDLKKINNPVINVIDEVDNLKVNIIYPDNSNNVTKDDNGNLELYQYFKSTVNGKVDKNVYECDSNYVCNNPVTDIKENTYYKTNDNNVVLEVTGESNLVNIEAKVVDKSNNEGVTEKQFDINIITFKKGSADTIDGKPNDVIKKCISEKDKSCKIKTPTAEKVGYTPDGWNTEENGTGSSLDVGVDVLVDESDTYYPILIQNPIYVYYHVNGGEIRKNTDIYEWTLDNEGIIYRDGKKDFYKVTSNGVTNQNGLVNWNDSNYVYITKKGHKAIYTKEWNTKSDGTGLDFNHTTPYTYQNYMDSGAVVLDGNNYRLDLYVNWKANTYKVHYFIGNGESSYKVPNELKKNDVVQECTYMQECKLNDLDYFGAIFPYSKESSVNYLWHFYGWLEGNYQGNSNLIDVLAKVYENDNLTITYTEDRDINLYAIGYRNLYFNSGVYPTSYSKEQIVYQYWNPLQLSIDNKLITSIDIPVYKEISGWDFVGYKHKSELNTLVDYKKTDVGKPFTPIANNNARIKSIYSRYIYMKYNANATGVTGSTPDDKAIQLYYSGYVDDDNKNVGAGVSKSTFYLPENGFNKLNYMFTKWSETSTSGPQYAPGYAYTTFNPDVDESNTKTMYANWVDAVNSYTVNHYKQKLNSTSYELFESEHLDGETYTTVTPSVKTYEGFTSPSAQTITIKDDGTSVVNYYYKRNKYKLTLNKNTGVSSVSSEDWYGNKSTEYEYGVNITINAVVSDGYRFNGWSGTNNASTTEYSFTMPAKAVSYTANAIQNKVRVQFATGGGTVTSSTTSSSGSSTYTFTTDANGIISRSTNGGSSTTYFHTLNYNEQMGQYGLSDRDDPNHLYITRTGYSTPEGSEWKCKSGPCKSSTYNDTTSYTADKLCDAKTNDCTIVLEPNWQQNKVKVQFATGGGTVKASTTSSSGSSTYTFTTDANGIISRSTNGGTASTYFHTLNYNEQMGQYGLSNRDDPNHLYITKDGYSTPEGSEWKCKSGPCISSTYSDTTSYTADKLCDASKESCTIILEPNWSKNKVYVKFSTNGGVVKSPTNNADNTKTYTFEANSDGIISKSTNGGAYTDVFHTISYDSSLSSDGLANWNNSNYLYISKDGYTTLSDQWKCLSENCKKTSYNHSNPYEASELCDASKESCTIVLGPNWTLKQYEIRYYLGNGTSTAGTTELKYNNTIQKCTHGQNCTLYTFSQLGGVFPYSGDDKSTNGKNDYGWDFGGWSTLQTGTTVNHSNGKTFTNYTSGNLKLYAVGKRKLYLYSGSPASYVTTDDQFWNPYSTSSSYLTDIKLTTGTSITGWTFIGYKGGSNDAKLPVAFDSSSIGVNIAASYNKWPYNRGLYERSVSLKFNENGGSGSTTLESKTQYYNSGITKGSSGTVSSVDAFTLPSNGFTAPSGKKFKEWNTKSDGTGTSYAPGATLTFSPAVGSSNTKTLYAIWVALDDTNPTCTISASLNSDGTKVILTANGSDNLTSSSNLKYSWTSSTSGFSSTKTNEVNSNATYTAYVKDEAGNVGHCQGVVSGTSVSKYDKTTKTCDRTFKSVDCKGKFSSLFVCNSGSECSGNTTTSGKCECYSRTTSTRFCSSSYPNYDSTKKQCYKLGWQYSTVVKNLSGTGTADDQTTANNFCASEWNNYTSGSGTSKIEYRNCSAYKSGVSWDQYWDCQCDKYTYNKKTYTSYSCTSGNNLGDGYCYTYLSGSCPAGSYRGSSSNNGDPNYCYDEGRSSCGGGFTTLIRTNYNYAFTSETTSATSCSKGTSFDCDSSNYEDSYVSKCTPTAYSCSSGTKLNNTYCFEEK